MHSSALHEENRLAAVFDELIENLLFVVVLTVLKTCKRTYSDDVAVASHHRYGLEQVFALVSVHDDAALCLQLPCALVDIEHDDIHTQVHSCFLCRQAGAQAVVEEYQHTGLVLTQILILVAVGFHCLRFFQGELEVAKVGYMLKNFHVFI